MTRPDWPIGSGTDEKKKMTKSLMLRNHFISFSLKIQELGHNVSSDNHKDCNNNEHKANNQKIEPAITTTATTTTTTMKTRPNKSRSSWFANMTGNKERRSGAQDFAFDSADLDYYMRNYSKSKKRQTTTRSNDDQSNESHDNNNNCNFYRTERAFNNTYNNNNDNNKALSSTSESTTIIKAANTFSTTDTQEQFQPSTSLLIQASQNNYQLSHNRLLLRTKLNNSGASNSSSAPFHLSVLKSCNNLRSKLRPTFLSTGCLIPKRLRSYLSRSRRYYFASKQQQSLDSQPSDQRDNWGTVVGKKPPIMTAQMASFLKLTLVGDGGVGKSCLILQYMYGDFVEEYEPTKADAYRRTITLQGDEVQIDILDTAGQEDYPAVRDGYLKHGDGFLLVFDLTNRETFESVKSHRENVLRVKAEEENLPIILVGNKCDLTATRRVTLDEATDLANKWRISYMETSAKTRQNVDKVFSEIFLKIKDLKKFKKNSGAAGPNGKKSGNSLTKEEEEAVRADSLRKRIHKYYKNAKANCTLL